jgi:hypothetical protein
LNGKKKILNTLPEWVQSVKVRIKQLNVSMSTNATFIFKDPDVAKYRSNFHDKFIVVPVDKAPN